MWDVFIINSVEQLQTLPKTQSEIDISPFLKTQKPSSTNRVEEGFCVFRNGIEEGFCVLRNGLISISDWLFGNVWSCSTLFIMKTSHKSDEYKRKRGGHKSGTYAILKHFVNMMKCIKTHESSPKSFK